MGQAYELYEGDKEIERFEVRDLRVKTRFAIDNAFYDEFTPIFGPTVSMVYVALVRHANKEQKTWPSQSLIAAQLGLTRQWVAHQLHILEIFNLIRSVRVGKRCTSRYYLIDEKQWRRDFDNLLSETTDAISEYESKQVARAEVMLTMSSLP